MVCGALCLVESSFGVGFETEEEGWRRGVEMEVVEGKEENGEDWERDGG